MKKLFSSSVTAPSFISIQSARAKAYVVGSLILLASCTSTQVRWDAIRMRKDVMVYYNDQIMENLIKARNHLPFVHVDIQSLTTSGASQISGTVGYGETVTNTGTNALTTQTTTTNVTGMSPTGPSSMHQVARVAGGLLESASHVAMRPFSYSVTPQRSETLQITANPALGSQAITTPDSTPLPKLVKTKTTRTTEKWQQESKEGEFEESEKDEPEEGELEKSESGEPEKRKRTEAKNSRDAPYEKITKTTERTRTAATPKQVTIYNVYEDYSKEPCKGGVLSHSPTQPLKGTYLPGTLKKWNKIPGTPQKYDEEYYFIGAADIEKYYMLCKKLFTKGQTGSLVQQLGATQAQVESLKAQLATPIPP